MLEFLLVETLFVSVISVAIAYIFKGTYYIAPAAAAFFLAMVPLIFAANKKLGLISKNEIPQVGDYLAITDILLFIYAAYQIFTVQTYTSIAIAMASFIIYDVLTIIVFERLSGRRFKDFILARENASS